MKKAILALSLVGLTLAGQAKAEPIYDTRQDVARIADETNRQFRGGPNWHQYEGRTSYQIAQLRREIRVLRDDLRRASAPPKVWHRYQRLNNSAERLEVRYQQGRIRGRDARNEVNYLRDEVRHLRGILRNRHIGGIGWR